LKPLVLLKLLLVRSPLHRLAAAPAAWLLRMVYRVKFAEWFHENDVPRLHLRTESRFDYQNRYALFDALCQELPLAQNPINYLEFGVATGASFRWWAEHNANIGSRFVGFDTFLGLPEKWGRFPQGAFATEGKAPDIPDSRCSYRIGPFRETLPPFAQSFSFADARTVVHLDADLYGSTVLALVTLAPRLKAGDILIFDEFADVLNEFRALLDVCRSFPLKLRLLRVANWGANVAFALE
jgi:O-methyltransferase